MPENTAPSSSDPAAPPPGRALGWAVVIAAAVVVAHTIHLQPWTLDDAYISFRYAENLAAGNGLVFNEGERVEGYTTFLWVLLLGAGASLGVGVEMWAKALGTLFTFACLATTALAYRFVPGLSARASSIATIFLGTCAVFTAWTMSGMEVPLAAFLVTATIFARVRAEETDGTKLPALTGTLAALATMARPEFGLLALTAAFFPWPAERARGRASAAVVVGFLLVFGPYFLWRLSYYGHPVPNTFYAKVGQSVHQFVRGLRYTADFAGVVAPLLAPPIVAALLASRRAIGGAPAFARFAGAVLVVHTLYVIAVGGDVMPAYRFYAPVLPALCLCCAAALEGLGVDRRRLALFVTVTAVYGLALLGAHRQLHARIVSLDKVGRWGREVGEWLREHAPPDAVHATNTAGSVPYFSKLRTIDMLGLNDVHIAHREMPNMGAAAAGHEKGDGAYVLSRRPDYIQLGSARGSRTPAEFVGDRELFGHPDFREHYELREFELPSGATLKLFVRKDGLGIRE